MYSAAKIRNLFRFHNTQYQVFRFLLSYFTINKLRTLLVSESTQFYGNNWKCLLHITNLNQILTNLNGIQGSTLTDLVARKPEGQSVLVRDILTNTTHIDIILTCCLKRHGVNEVSRIVDQSTTDSE